ncbi:retropepsin-like aspartic protease [Spirosoma sp. SC4-14]|uniref:retropepsin-like aspartic protease n=1 Tax=Spirosoma sp. SC4-14 TaxID=3128900 RepID=UPI0030D177AC
MNSSRLSIFTVLLLIINLLVVDRLATSQPIRQQNPITIQDGLIYVQVRVNGHGPYNFILNSGVSGIGRIDQRIARELGLKVVGYQENREANQVKREFLVTIDKLSVGQLTHTDLKLAVINHNEIPRELPIDGMIGRDFFTRYLITMDGPARQLIVSADTLSVRAKGVSRYSSPFLILGKLGPKDLLFNLEMGSSLPLLFPKASLMGIHYTDTTNQRVVTLANTTFVLQEAILHDELILGGIRLKDQTIYYSDKAHQINVGVDFLKEHIVSFDQRKKLIRIE